MPDPTPIPVIPSLCTSQSSMITYVNYLNLSFDLALRAINEELGTSLELPGIPQVVLPGLPEIYVPPVSGWDLGLKQRQPPRPTGFIGKVFPMRGTDKKIEGKIRMPDLTGFTVGATGGYAIPGTDVSEILINWINQNFEILVSLLAEQGVEYVPVLVPYTELCPEDLGATPGMVLTNDLVFQNLQSALDAATGGGGGGGCGIPDFIDGSYSGSSSTTIGCWTVQHFAGDTPPTVTMVAATQSFNWLYAANPNPSASNVWAKYALPDCSVCTIVAGNLLSASARLRVFTNNLGDPLKITLFGLEFAQLLSNGSWGFLDSDSESVSSGNTGTFTLSLTNVPVQAPGSLFFGGPLTWSDQVRIFFSASPSLPVGTYDGDATIDQLVFTLS